jgi:hypothetical protein
MELINYLNDGANYQARAVLMYLQGISHDLEDPSPNVARWENCREQGYIVSIRTKNHNKQLNIIFFEHRNSDSICAVKWEQLSTNSIGITNAEFINIYKDKYDVSFSVSYGEIKEMAYWIHQQLEDFTNQEN